MVIADSGSVHPRLRGELFAGEQDSFSNFGSSPLTRGTLFTVTGTFLCGRFIPAYAGNSLRVNAFVRMNTVHPRLRGELSGAVVEALIVGGSSPLTRGTPGSNVRPKDVLRFIPAYAGNSQDTHLVRDLPSVHPRLRGELKKLRLRAAATNGSSPLTRGTRRDEYPVLGHLRFIPAYAGNSLLGFYRRSGRTVHPRLRGELIRLTSLCRLNIGSSPLTRGTLTQELRQHNLSAVHPRLRGELRFCVSSV